MVLALAERRRLMLTWGVSCTEMVRLPWAMATWEMRTSAPITITPDTSSITTRAALSGSTSSCSMAVMKLDMSWPAGGLTVTMVGLSATATPGKCWLITSAMRREVVKSGFFRVRRIWVMLASWKLFSRSTTAPDAIRPAVGTPRVTLVPELPVADTAPVCTVPWATA